MRFSRTGGIIAAANPELAFPLKKVGTISAVKRIALLFKQAGVFPIVVLTGKQNDEIRYQLSKEGVIFLPIDEGVSELLASTKVGLEFLQSVCQKVIFTPVNAPLFSAHTVSQLLQNPGDIVIPSFQGKGGHPIVIATKVINSISQYEGGDGLRGALTASGIQRRWVEVTDPGVVLHTNANPQEKEFHLVNHLSLESDRPFFSDRAKLLLFLISKTHGMRLACDLMAVSYSKGWSMMNQLEAALGFEVIQRRHGGKHGGRTDLTPKGYQFLLAYQKMVEKTIGNSHGNFREFLNEFTTLS